MIRIAYNTAMTTKTYNHGEDYNLIIETSNISQTTDSLTEVFFLTRVWNDGTTNDVGAGSRKEMELRRSSEIRDGLTVG